MSSTNVYLTEDGILVYDYGDHPRLSSAVLREAFHRFEQQIAPAYPPGTRFPALVETSKMLNMSYNAARYCSSDEVVAATSAMAYVPKTFLEKNLVQMFVWYHNPPYPFKVFNSREEALEWLHMYLDDSGPRQLKHPLHHFIDE